MINTGNKVNVKDVSSKDFIEAFAKHLKKGNKIKMPEVSTNDIALLFRIFNIKLYLIVGCLR